jgi:hypothetical protein
VRVGRLYGGEEVLVEDDRERAEMTVSFQSADRVRDFMDQTLSQLAVLRCEGHL